MCRSFSREANTHLLGRHHYFFFSGEYSSVFQDPLNEFWVLWRHQLFVLHISDFFNLKGTFMFQYQAFLLAGEHNITALLRHILYQEIFLLVLRGTWLMFSMRKAP